MRLIWRDSSVTRDPNNPDDYSDDQFVIHNEESDNEVRVDFEQFGRGYRRRHKFEVKVTWADVRNMMTAFIEMESPDALYLRSLIKLGEAVQDAGWSTDEPPEELFDIILPQSN